jgi:hypothetical protein
MGKQPATENGMALKSGQTIGRENIWTKHQERLGGSIHFFIYDV